MQIEIRTTAVKLTKSIVNQMSRAGVMHLRDGVVLGYVLNVVSNSHKSLIISHAGNYFTLPANYERSGATKSIYRRVGRGTASHEFKTAEEREEFWHLYQRALSDAQQIYI